MRCTVRATGGGRSGRRIWRDAATRCRSPRTGWGDVEPPDHARLQPHRWHTFRDDGQSLEHALVAEEVDALDALADLDVAARGIRDLVAAPCIRVQKSTATPYWVQRLRENLVGTFLTGEFLRADVFRTSVRFAGLSERSEDKPKGYTKPDAKLTPEEPSGTISESDSDPEGAQEEDDEPCGCCSPAVHSASNGYTTYAHQEEADALAHADAYKTQPLRAHDDDELRFSVLARRVHINNTEGRVYTFGAIDAQMRRNWVDDRGSFAMVAEVEGVVRERLAPLEKKGVLRFGKV
ncbi:hypothetical protein NUW54_g8766 [Trametes sanguinea]|uniref:Uncharacterized protein n=1 Tax=Trametes sanguinea TaxID=158606 RepID=A0ACC1PCJ9_9APHY|nr:hypothetical protein NUW54_g8766 [Trametes sanguinea]